MSITVNTLSKLKSQAQPIACLTCYDASTARLMELSKLDVILIGDSLGTTIQGHTSTVPVTLEDICYHTRCVANGNTHSLLIGDMPFMSYRDPDTALETATELMQAGAHMVKLEGGVWLEDTVHALTQRGIPVCAHIGLQPQSINALGKYSTHGKTQDEADRLLVEAQTLEAAGAAIIVFECIEAHLAERITQKLTIPSIGIGSSAGCDGQILVIQDMLGMSAHTPYFVECFLNESNPSIQAAISAYIKAVQTKTFPSTEQATYSKG